VRLIECQGQGQAQGQGLGEAALERLLVERVVVHLHPTFV
jgi:hypothetical protein